MAPIGRACGVTLRRERSFDAARRVFFTTQNSALLRWDVHKPEQNSRIRFPVLRQEL
jgi:hypothetical protein